jgi:hypothetical protein
MELKPRKEHHSQKAETRRNQSNSTTITQTAATPQQRFDRLSKTSDKTQRQAHACNKACGVYKTIIKARQKGKGFLF